MPSIFPNKMHRKGMVSATRFISVSSLLLVLGTAETDAQDTSELPNIIWITIEDINPDLGAYGDSYAHTPNIDQFAEQALRYDVAWSTVPVCSPARTALITGMYPTSIGGHNHRSQVGLPEHVQMYPQLLREHGYYTTNNYKEDYNVVPFDGNSEIWHESSRQAHYHNRSDESTPFFAVFNNLDSHGNSIKLRTELPYHDPDQVPLPPYHPDTPVFRRDWAQYYHSITAMDEWFGRKIQQICDEGLMDNTIIFVFSDHGGGMPRHKQLVYNTGLHVPMFVYIPEKYRHLAPDDYKSGGFTRRPVEFVDLASTLLSLISIEPPEWMQGQAFMGVHEDEPRKYVYGARGRMDERADMARSVRDDRYIYIRNYMPHLKHGHFSQYMYTLASTEEWRDRYREGRLVLPETRVWEPKPPEELYDLTADPHEVNNLVDSRHYREVLDRMRAVHRRQMIRTRDVQFLSEAEMHRRAKGSTMPVWEMDGDHATSIFEMAQDSQRYPIERILAMAELAAGHSYKALPMLESGLNDDDPAIRYWAAMGILIRGQRAFDIAAANIRRAIGDENPSVRIVAAEILATFGTSDERDQALQLLVEMARPDEQGVYVALEALNVVNHIGDIPKSVKTALLENKEEDPNAFWRGANEFIIRLLPGYVHPGLEERRRIEQEYRRMD